MPGGIARSALVPDLADLASMRRERANAFADGVMRISGSIGAPLAVLLIAFMGTKNLLWLDGASYFVSALIVGVLIRQTQAKKVDAADESGYLGELGEGLRFILRDSVLWGVILVVVVTNLLDQALISVVAPTYIIQTFHSPLALGWMYGVFGGMAFVGTLAFGAIGHRLPRQLTLGVGFTIGGAIRYWILLVPLIPLLVVAYAIAGLGIAPINPLIDTVLQERTPVQMRARVFGTTTAGAYIGIPIGALLGGVLVPYLGVQACLIIMGAVYFVATLSLLVNPGLKKIGEEIDAR